MRSKIYRNESKPNYTRGVHGESDVLCFIKVLWNLPRFKRIHSTQSDEYHIVEQGQDYSYIGAPTPEHHCLSIWVAVDGVWEFYPDPDDGHKDLY